MDCTTRPTATRPLAGSVLGWDPGASPRREPHGPAGSAIRHPIHNTWRGENRTLLSIIFDQLNVIFIVSKRPAGLGSLNHVDVRDRLVEDINYQSTVVIIPPKHAHTCAVLQKYQIRFIKCGSRKAGLNPVKLCNSVSWAWGGFCSCVSPHSQRSWWHP